MKKRILCTFTLPVILWFIIMGIIRERELSNIPTPWPEGYYLSVEGTVYKTSHTKTATTVYLKNISYISESDNATSEFTNENYNLNTKILEFYQKSNILVYLKEEQEFHIGDYVRITGKCSYPSRPRNEGGFDARSYYGCQKIYLTLRKGEICRRKTQKSFVRETFRLAAAKIASTIDSVASEVDGQILKSLLLGDKTDLDNEVKSLYQDNGIIHVLAISGLHISMVGLTLFHLLRAGGISFASSGFISFSLILAYGLLTGFPTSAIRAIIMFGIYILAQIEGRTVDMPTSLSLAGVLMLCGTPALITQSGFLLSFGAVAGVLTTDLFTSKILKKGPLGVSVSSFLVTLPITAYFFYQVPLSGILLNLFVVPSMTLVVGFGFLGTVLGFLSNTAAGFALAPVHYILKLTLYVCEKVRMIPYLTIITGKPTIDRIVVYYVLLYLALLLWNQPETETGRRVVQFLKKSCMIVYACLVLFLNLNMTWSVTFLDVGQGDGACIHTETRHIYMIDGGSSSEQSPGKYMLEPFLKSQGYATVDGWFLSHYDNDHVNGLIEILENYQVNCIGKNSHGITIRRILLPDIQVEEELKDKILDLAGKNQIPVTYLARGDRFQDGETVFEVIGPKRDTVYEDSNAGSMVVKVSCQKFSILFTGDVQGEGEKELFGEELGEIDILKVAHHGSKNSSSMEVLAHIQPKVAVISCGKNNRYGHPHEEVLENLKELGVKVLRTDEIGEIRFTE